MNDKCECGHEFADHLVRCTDEDCRCIDDALHLPPPSAPVEDARASASNIQPKQDPYRPPVAGVDLPDGTRVRVTVEGTVEGALLRSDSGWHLNFRECSSVVAVPVVPEPGKWYVTAGASRYLCLPDGSLICWYGWTWGDVSSLPSFKRVPLVECSAPAEFGGTP